ncbi:hypothetical protein HZX00_003294 [Salmonella enterica]|nr:hypothetical protein [Salmonella enterica]
MPLLIGALVALCIWAARLIIPAVIEIFISKFIFGRVVIGLTLAFYASVFLAFTTFLNTKFVTLLNSVGFFDNPYFLTGVSLLPSNVSTCISAFTVVYLAYLALRFKIIVVRSYSNQSSTSGGLPSKVKTGK